MASVKAVLKNVGPKLVPFFKTVTIYFVLFIPDASPSWFACLIKCLPILSLVAFVLLHGMSLGDERHSYSRRILAGLVLGGVGDALLIYGNTHFVYGMICFGLGHLAYVSAFGFAPLNVKAGVVCTALAFAIYAAMLPGLDGAMVPAVAVYFLLLSLMTWRSIARVQLLDGDDLWTWTKLCGCAGGIMFCVSDFFIGVNKFIVPLPYAQALIMVPYYAAQLGIALSVVDSTVTMTTSSSSNDTSPTQDSASVTPLRSSKVGSPARCTTRSQRIKIN